MIDTTVARKTIDDAEEHTLLNLCALASDLCDEVDRLRNDVDVHYRSGNAARDERGIAEAREVAAIAERDAKEGACVAITRLWTDAARERDEARAQLATLQDALRDAQRYMEETEAGNVDPECRAQEHRKVDAALERSLLDTFAEGIATHPLRDQPISEVLAGQTPLGWESTAAFVRKEDLRPIFEAWANWANSTAAAPVKALLAEWARPPQDPLVPAFSPAQLALGVIKGLRDSTDPLVAYAQGWNDAKAKSEEKR